MNTKTILLAFAAVAMLSTMAGAQSVYDNSLSLVNVSVSPNPVTAGGNVMIRFQMYNGYDNWLYGTVLQASGTYPLLNASPLSGYKIGVINPGETTGHYNYTFAIPDTTPSGTYTVDFSASYFVYAATGTEVASSALPISFYVQNRPAIKVVASSPQGSTLYAGHNQTIDLVVQNTGYGAAKNVSITVGRATGLNILSSVTSFYAQDIPEGAAVSEPLLVGAKNVSNTSLTVNVTYYSSTLKRSYSTNQQVNLSVAPAAEFAISSLGYGPSVGATDVPLSFRITHTGTSAATQVQVSLESPYPITPVAGTAYIENLGPGASANMTFMVSIDSSGVPGNYPVTLTEQWKQPNGAVNQQYSGSNNYYVPVIAASGIGGMAEDAIVVLIVIVAAAVLVRRRSRRNSGKSDKKEKK